MVRREIEVPLPGVPTKSCLDVDLRLLDIELVTEDLHGRFDQAGVPCQPGEQGVPQVQSHCCSNLASVLLHDIGRGIFGEYERQPLSNDPDLFL